MKKLILLILSISFGMGVYAQSKNFNYQAVVRDDKGAVVKSKDVKVQFTIDMGDTAKTPEYVEEHALTTDLFGRISTKIGTGTATLGQFDTLNWKGNARRLKVEIDLSGGGTYALLSEAILASVPYALHAQTVDNVDDSDADPTNEIQMLSISNDTLFLSGGGFVKLAAGTVNLDNDSTNELIKSMSLSGDTLVLSQADSTFRINLGSFNQNNDLANLKTQRIQDSLNTAAALALDLDRDSTNEIQRLTMSNDTIFLSNGGFVKVAGAVQNNDNDSTNEIQILSISNDTILLTNGGFAVLPALPAAAFSDSSSTNEIQVISISNDTIMLSNGGFAVLPAVPANNDNDSTNEIQTLSMSNDTVLLSNGGFVNLSAYNTWTKSGSDINFTTGKVSVGGTGTTGTFNVTDATGTGVNIISQGTGINTGIQVRALSSSTNNSAMYGLTGLAEGSAGNAASAGTGNHIGVRGISRGKGTLGTGVYGESVGSITFSSNSTSRGVEGFSNATLAKFNFGVSGATTASRGSATSGNNSGVYGYANGNGNENYGINGVTDGTGTYNYGGGFASYGGGTGTKKNYGVYSYVGFADTNIAFYADANNSSSKLNYGIYSEVSGGTSLAGRFVGNVRVEGDLQIIGNISKGGGTFKIDHPVDPENKYLIHSFVESPDMMNVYNGNATTDASGIVEITLPDYFEASNKEFRYQLTPIGQFAQVIVKEEISNNKFIIQTDKPNVKVSWQVTGIRNDPYSNDHRIVPVVDKPANEKGYYLHPESFGQDASKAIYKPMNSVDYKKSIEEAKNLKGSHSDAE